MIKLRNILILAFLVILLIISNIKPKLLIFGLSQLIFFLSWPCSVQIMHNLLILLSQLIFCVKIAVWNVCYLILGINIWIDTLHQIVKIILFFWNLFVLRNLLYRILLSCRCLWSDLILLTNFLIQFLQRRLFLVSGLHF